MKGYSYCLCTLLFLLAACEKKIEVVGGDLAGFHVALPKDTYKVNEEVEFNLKGTPGIITCYPGDLYKNYVFKDGRTMEFPNILVSFDSEVGGGTQENQLSVLVSSDFDGKHGNVASIRAAKWHDITDRFVLGTEANVFKPSGSVDVGQFVVPGKPLYVAFRYTARARWVDGDAGLIRRWRINNFQVSSNTSVGPFTFATMNTAGFTITNSLDEKNNAVVPRTTVAATLLTFWGNVPTVENDPTYETWMIANPLNVDSRDLGPDRPVSVKGYLMPKVENFKYTYTVPGTYTAYFVAANKDVKNSQETIREVQLNIVP